MEDAGLEGALLQIRAQAVAENAGLEEELLLMRTQAQVVKYGLERQLLLVRTQAVVKKSGLEEQLRQETVTLEISEATRELSDEDLETAVFMASMFSESTEFAAQLTESSETDSKTAKDGTAEDGPTKRGPAKDGGNNYQPARAHASMKAKPKVCPACNGQHSFSDKGGLLYRTQLSFCPDFNDLGPFERAHLLQSAKGCQLCLDWTGYHQRDKCTAKTYGKLFWDCSIQINGVPCGAKHNSLLHGLSSRYCNLV